MSRFWYWYWASFGISLVTYYLLIYFVGITTLFAINPEGCLLAAIISIKIYSNAEAEKEKILSENNNKSGIYMWINTINDKRYIGSALNLSNRLSFYFSFSTMQNSLKIVEVIFIM